MALSSFSCDIFHPGTDWTSAPPDVPGVAIKVRACFPAFMEKGEEDGTDVGHFTHEGWVGGTVDVRDGYQGAGVFSPQGGGMVFIAGCQFEVMFVGRVKGKGKKLYLRRRYVPWDTTGVPV
jgi:hypothetical protein